MYPVQEFVSGESPSYKRTDTVFRKHGMVSSWHGLCGKAPLDSTRLGDDLTFPTLVRALLTRRHFANLILLTDCCLTQSRENPSVATSTSDVFATFFFPFSSFPRGATRFLNRWLEISQIIEFVLDFSQQTHPFRYFIGEYFTGMPGVVEPRRMWPKNLFQAP